MKKKKVIIVFLVIVAVTIGLVMKYRTAATDVEPDPVFVQAATVKESTLPLEVHIIGTLVARSVEVTAEAAGHVDKILFQDGTFVNEGAALIQLDDATYKAQYDSASVKYLFSISKLKRMALLAKRNFVSQQTIDELEADAKEKKAEAKQIAVMLNKMKLTAPFAGMVGKSKVNPGDYVNVGASVVTLTDTKHLHVEYNVPEKYFPALKLGQEVSITTSAYPGKLFTGKVAFISPTINADNRSVSLYAEVPNEHGLLAAGMFVNVNQSLGREERVLMIPARSLVPILDGQQVYKIVDGKAYGVTVLVGKRTENSVQITEGLSSGDVIISDGQLKVKNGMPVKIKT